MCAALDLLLVKDWPKQVHGTLFDGQTAKVFQREFVTPEEMSAASDDLEEFLAQTGFQPSKIIDIVVATSEALENARKSICETMPSEDVARTFVPIAITAITSQLGALIIFVRDHADTKGITKMKFELPDVMNEHGRGSFIMQTLASFMAIIPESDGEGKEVILGFCEK